MLRARQSIKLRDARREDALGEEGAAFLLIWNRVVMAAIRDAVAAREAA